MKKILNTIIKMIFIMFLTLSNSLYTGIIPVFAEENVEDVFTNKEGANTEEIQEEKEQTDVTNPFSDGVDIQDSKPRFNIDYSRWTLTEKDKNILKDYKMGITAPYFDIRKEIAERTGLDKYVDDDYFLNDSFYNNFSSQMLIFDQTFLLNRNNKKEYIEDTEIFSNTNKKKETKLRSRMATPRNLQVTEEKEHVEVWGVGTLSNGIWRLSNNRLSFCANGLAASPKPGDSTSMPYVVNNANLRKILYYGYDGPENKLASKGYSVDAQIVLTDDFASVANTGNSVAMAAASGYHWNGWVSSVYHEIIALPDPIQYGYEAYMVDVAGTGINWQGNSSAKQPLVYGDYNPTGSLHIRKKSANPDFTDNNSNYSLNGAEFTIYTDANCTQIAFTMNTDENGRADKDGIKAGTYYIKETKAPKGYKLDNGARQIEIKSGDTLTYNFTNEPISAKVNLKKTSANPTVTNNNCKYSLAGAVYKIYKNSNATGEVGTLTTDANGDTNTVDLSPATYYIKETKAPKGYMLDEDIYSITLEIGKTGTLSVEDWPKTNPGEDDPVINKYDTDLNSFRAQGDASLAGAEFRIEYYDNLNNSPKRHWVMRVDENGAIYLDDAHKVSGDAFYTNSDGQNVFPVGYVKVQETKAPVGYDIDAAPKTAEVKEEGTAEVLHTLNTFIMTDPVIKGNFTIHKTLSKNDGQSNIAKPEKGATFVAVAKKHVDKYGSVEEAFKHKSEFTDAEWDEITTDEDGNATSRMLAYGTYIVKQTGAQPEIELLDEEFEFKVTQSGQATVSYSISNVPSSYYLKLVKKDANTGQTVSFSPTSFKIRYTGTENYLTMKIGSKKYDTFTTTSESTQGIPAGAFVINDDPGTVTTPLKVEAGSYELVEVQTPKGYLEHDPIPFSVEKGNVAVVDEDGNGIIEVVMEDLVPVAEVEGQKGFEGDIMPSAEGTEEETVNSHLERKATFQLTAAENIYDPATGALMYKKGDPVTKDNPDGHYTTQNGMVRIDSLPMGHGKASYHLKEVQTTDGYVLDENTYTIDAVQEDSTTEVYTKSLDLYNELTRVEISKQDVAGEEVPGAHLTIIDKDGNTVTEWTSTTEKHVVKGLTAGEEYTLRETLAPDGYVQATEIKFTVKNTSNLQKVTMVDERVSVYKQHDSLNIAGAQMVIRTKDGAEVDQWTTDGNVHYASGLTAGETYVLEETKAPEGYVQNLPVEFTVNNEGKNQTIKMIDKQILHRKLDTDGNYLSGAQMQVADETGNIVDSWTSGSDMHAVSNLVVGQTYTLTEVQAPEGYVAAEPQTFTVEDDNKDVTITFIDTQVVFEKLDTKQNGIAGALMSVTDKDGNVVDSWKTDGSARAISGTKANQTYTIEESEAPYGYVKASPVEFTASPSENLNLSMTDTEETVKKVDQFGRLVDGAVLRILSEDQSMILDEWTTGSQIVELDDMQKAELRDKGTVTMEAPLKVIPFEPMENPDKEPGLIEQGIEAMQDLLGLNDEADAEEETEEPEEPAVPDKMYTITIKEVPVETLAQEPSEEEQEKADEAESALTSTDYEAGYILHAIDEEGNHFYYNIDETGRETVHRAGNLETNTSYILREMSAPENHTPSEDISFTTLDNEDQTVEMKDIKFRKVTISKKDIATSEELPGAELTVTDKDGSVVDKWVSTNEPHEIEGLVVGEEYTLTEIQAPQYYELAESIKFVVEDDLTIEQHIEMFDKRKENDVEISKKDIATSEELPGADLTVTDENGNVVDKWTSTNEPHKIRSLQVGKEYTLTEVQAPQYYELAESIKFMVEDNMTAAQHIEMFDKHKENDVSITKYDITDKKELPGAELEIRDENDKVVEKWTSTDKAHIVKGLLTGKKYTLTETRAPKGYKVAEKIEFEVKDAGTVVQEVHMYDEELEKPKTGLDFGNYTGWIIGGFASLAVIAGILFIKIKKREE